MSSFDPGSKAIMTTQLIKYNELVMNEGGIQVQRGMNFGVRGSYSIVLMSTAKNAPYVDQILDGGVIKYEGHDKERMPLHQKKTVDQPMANNSGTLTQNGLFFQAAENYKEGRREEPAKIKVYRKIRKGIWVDMGFYNLIDGFIEHDGNRNVFKFLLEPIFDDIEHLACGNFFHGCRAGEVTGTRLQGFTQFSSAIAFFTMTHFTSHRFCSF